MAAGQKMRLNVSVVGGGAKAPAKILVCVDEGAFVQDLSAKVRKMLAKAGAVGDLLRVENSNGAHLPEEEPVGDVLRDGEEIFAVMKPPETLDFRQAEAIQRGDLDALLKCDEAPPPQEEEPKYEPMPGPAVTFEEDLREEAAATQEPATPSGLPAGPDVTRLLPGSRSTRAGDWEVADLAPKLREFVATRFKEARGVLAEPGNGYITVSIRPPGAELTQPVRYSIARIDVIEFERLCGRKVQEARARLDFFARCREALDTLLCRGAASGDYAPNMLPYRYRADEEFDDLLKEADSECFGEVEGTRPVIILDTSGPVGEALPLLKAGLKRMLYSFLVTKARFNLLAFAPSGRTTAFEADMAQPSARRLREAEEWLDGLRPVRPGGAAGGGPDLLEALSLGLAAREADVVYLLTPGPQKRVDGDRLQAEVRARNARGMPIHVIGVNCEVKAEVELRRLAEDSKGTFRAKRFDAAPAFQAAEPRRAPLRPSREDERLTIGGQLAILDIMSQEEEAQCDDWLEEQRCANQLLLATASQQPVPDAQEARLHAARHAERVLERPTLQQLIEGGGAGPPPPCLAGSGAAAAAAMAAACGRRGPSRRGGSRGRASSQPRLGAHAVDARRPSPANPWDRVPGVVRIAQLKKAAEAAAAGLSGPCPMGHGAIRIGAGKPAGTPGRARPPSARGDRR